MLATPYSEYIHRIFSSIYQRRARVFVEGVGATGETIEDAWGRISDVWTELDRCKNEKVNWKKEGF